MGRELAPQPSLASWLCSAGIEVVSDRYRMVFHLHLRKTGSGVGREASAEDRASDINSIHFETRRTAMCAFFFPTAGIVLLFQSNRAHSILAMQTSNVNYELMTGRKRLRWKDVYSEP